MNKIKIAIWILCAIYTIPCGVLLADNVFYFNFPSSLSSWTVMLPTPESKVVYRNSYTGVFIEHVVCNGKNVEARSMAGFGSGPDLLAIEYSGGQVVYQFNPDRLLSWENHLAAATDEQYLMMREFRITENHIRSLEIDYRVRFPNGTISKLYRVYYTEFDDVLTILSIPKSTPKY